MPLTEKMEVETIEGVTSMNKKSKEEIKNKLNTTQEVLYGRDFRMADRAAGYTKKQK